MRQEQRATDTTGDRKQAYAERTRTGQPGAPPENDTRNPHAVAMSKLGASKGGKARAANLSKAKRKAIAKKAAAARWKGD